MKKIVLLLVIFMSMTFLTACVSNNETQNANEQNAVQEEQQAPENEQPQGPPPQGEPSTEVISENEDTKVVKLTFPDGNVVQVTEKNSIDKDGNHILTKDSDNGRKEFIKFVKISDDRENAEIEITEPDGSTHKIIDEIKINPDGSREVINHTDIN